MDGWDEIFRDPSRDVRPWWYHARLKRKIRKSCYVRLQTDVPKAERGLISKEVAVGHGVVLSFNTFVLVSTSILLPSFYRFSCRCWNRFHWILSEKFAWMSNLFLKMDFIVMNCPFSNNMQILDFIILLCSKCVTWRWFVLVCSSELHWGLNAEINRQ